MGLKEDIFELRKEIQKEKKYTDEEELYKIKEVSPLEKRITKRFGIFRKVVSIIFGIFICFLAVKILSSTNNLIMLPFSLCIMLAALSTVAQAFDKDFLSNSIGKICIAIFLLMWMGFLGFATYNIGKNGADILMYLMLTLFWLAGFYMIYKYFIKKN